MKVEGSKVRIFISTLVFISQRIDFFCQRLLTPGHQARVVRQKYMTQQQVVVTAINTGPAQH